MTILRSMIQRIQAGFSAPRRRALAGKRSLATAGLECLEDRRVMSADGWLPGLNNFEVESNDTRATADQIAVTSVANPNADVVFTGAIRRTDDVDYYKFTLHKTSAVQLDVYRLNPSYQMLGDIDLKLEDSSGQQLEISNRVGGSSERINKELSAGTYFIKVYPYNSSGFGVSYQVRLQSIASTTPDLPVVPGTPNAAGPSFTSYSTPTFYWTAAANATHYELAVDNTTTGQTNAVYKSNLIDTTYTPSESIADGVYHVRVRAWNESVPGSWSSVFDFTLRAAPPGKSTVTGPSNTSDTTPTFTWTSLASATRYELWVSNTANGQRVIHETNLTGVPYTSGTAMAIGNYTVWVRAWNGNMPGSWSQAHGFSVRPEPPGTSRVTAPLNTDDTTPTFTWTPISDATRYELWVNNKITGQKVIHLTDLSEPNYTPDSEMAVGTYAVSVRVWNGNLPGSWSPAHVFSLSNVKPGTSVVATPVNTGTPTPTFTWTSATNATQYELWVTHKTTGRKVIHEMNLTDTAYTPGSAMAAGVHTVWVRAWNGGVPGAWSAGRDFTVTAAINSDPNGLNNTWQQATLLRHLGRGTTPAVVKFDVLTENDSADFYRVTWDNSRTHVSIGLKVSVLDGDVADLRIKVYHLFNGKVSEITTFNRSQSGNTVTLSSNPMIVGSIVKGLFYEVTSVTGKANLSYRIEG